MFFDTRRRHDAVGIVLGAHVHQYHVRALLERDTQGLGSIGNGGNNGHIGLVANGARQALAQDGLVFDYKDANHELLLWTVALEASGMDTVSVKGGAV